MFLILFFVCNFAYYCGDDYKLCPEPDQGQDYNNYLNTLKGIKDNWRSRTGFTGDQYDEVSWTQTNIIHTQVHPYDRYLYDRVNHRYTVEKYLNYTQKFGGVDSILFWPTYTQIGADDRNQYDLHRVLPGGMDAIRKMVEEFHSYGVKVLLPLNPWDSNTRWEHVDDSVAMIDLVIEAGADGFNGDTYGTIPKDYWDYAVSKGAFLAMEPEWFGSIWDVTYITLGWGYYWMNDGPREIGQACSYWPKPGVDHMKIVDGRRMTHVTDRWCVDKTTMLQLAYFNANGVNAWENVWGVYNTMLDRDSEVLKRTSHILRYFSESGHTVIDIGDWQPHYPTSASASDCIYTSLWRFNSQEWGGDTQLALFVNYCDKEVTNIQFDLSWWSVNYVYDCWNGKKLQGTTVSQTLDSRGYGCILATENVPSSSTKFTEFMSERISMTQTPISQYSAEFKGLQQTMVPKQTSIATNTDGMVLIAKTNYRFKAYGSEIEGTNAWVDFQFPWESQPNRNHDYTISVGPFYIDKHPVTNADYFVYLTQSGYTPRDDTNYLKHWMEWTSPVAKNCYPNGDSTTDNSNGAVFDRCCSQNDYNWVADIEECQRICMTAEGCNCITFGGGKCYLRKDCDLQNCDNDDYFRTSIGTKSTYKTFQYDYRDAPVTYVSYNEADAYCKFLGKRLPHAYEWQLAAQGNDGRNYPWGWNDDWNRRPPTTDNRWLAAPYSIGQHSNGASPYGVEDMVKHVWEYTDAFFDDHNMAALVKGGSNYNPDSSAWYFSQPDTVYNHMKYFLMDDSYERAGTVGFRCVSDTAESPAGPYHYESVPVSRLMSQA